jgi:hypothetical protein
MDYLTEARKFVQRAQDASHKEVIEQHLAMADWYLREAISERDGADANGRQRDDRKSADLPPKPA